MTRRAAAQGKAAIPTDLTALKGVGPALAEKLSKLQVFRPADLLFLLPNRYEDRTRLTPIGQLRLGQRAVLEAEIELAEVVFRRRRTLLVRVGDGTGFLTLRFFYFSRAQQNMLSRGKRLRCYGEVRPGPNGIEMVHPEFTVLKPGEQLPMDELLTPIYPTTEGLQQFRIRKLTAQALDNWLSAVPELLPADWRGGEDLPTLAEALAILHQPPRDVDLAELEAGQHPAQRRLALEELLAQHLSLREVRLRATRQRAVPLPESSALADRFLKELPFALTGDQQRAVADIRRDIAAPHPMMRLVQGDVGCGKTVVAALAALHAVSDGHQVALMAPTELLAEQHRDDFNQWCQPLGVDVTWLSGSQKAAEKRRAYEAIATGAAQIVVGTHALFQEGLEYHSLALVIVDEQHRFGVHQRLELMQKGSAGDYRPHQLVMTATPIPRTLAMTLYADLDTTVIREMPPGRKPVNTVAIADERRGELVARVRNACAEGRQAYWVCPLIEESEVLEYQDAESTYEMLKEALPGVNVGLVHGRMKQPEKDRVMKAFAANEVGVLVATTVIEVGVNVPNASLMVIENAERMGLSQLHQLRGRVGRGDQDSNCVLIYRQPLANIARQRVDVLRNTNDGFEVARKDLELRGPGEVLGKKQTGSLNLRVADLARDADLMPVVHELSSLLEDQPAVRAELVERWIGASERYGDV